jgi:outer membrane protein TolC
MISSGISAESPLELSVSEVRQRVLQSNRGVQVAKEEVTKAQSEIVTARAGAFPEINLSSFYRRDFSIAPVFFEADGETQQLKFGFKNNFGASISLRQPLWEGGKVFTAYKIAKQYHRYAQVGSDQVGAVAVYNGELLMYKAILDDARLAVLEQALSTAEKNLEVVEAHHSQGMVSRFELMRARVERSNILPKILGAESEVRLSKKRLLTFLGINLDQSVMLVEPVDDTTLENMGTLEFFTDSALVSRRELEQVDLLVDMTRSAVKVARSGYFPSLAAVSNYSWQSQSDEFTLSKNEASSFTAGLTLSLPIFDGGITRGAVSKMKAEHRQSLINQQQLIDQIRLEVEQAYDQLLQTKKMLEIHHETIEQAEEGLRIADLRYEAGEGTLLEILSAQTVLTDVRTSLAEAKFAFRCSLAALKLASNIDKIGN